MSESISQSEQPASSLPRPGDRIGLIAGNGRFPLLFAENASRLGYLISAVAHVGETSPELTQYVDRIYWIRIGQFGKAITVLKQDGVQHAVMLGGIRKTHLFKHVRPDFRAMALFSRLRQWKDDVILREIAAELEREGITIHPSTFGLQRILAEEGLLTNRRLTKKEREDIAFGWEIASAIGRLDIGQCIVVKDRVVVAVEAVEGTDETIRRGGQLAHEGTVVIKRCKPQQDLRFDLPAVGPKTIAVMKSVGASALAVEAHKTVLLDRQELLAYAQEAAIAVVGIGSTSPDDSWSKMAGI
ncbi:MAG: LpxI family protein [Nitrospirae bacterium]|nr:MAG: LpxI family protein [Nitrospirota bacterium]